MDSNSKISYSEKGLTHSCIFHFLGVFLSETCVLFQRTECLEVYKSKENGNWKTVGLEPIVIGKKKAKKLNYSPNCLDF